MNLITWNVQWCLGADGVLDPARIVDHARAMADFDVLCLQEVADNFPELNETPRGDQFRKFADLLPGFQAIEGVALETRDAEGRPKRFGNMILTRLPVIQVLRHTLPWGARENRNMPRGLLEVIIDGPFGPLRVMTTHLEYSHPDLRRPQIEAIRSIHEQATARAAAPREDGPHTYRRTTQPASAILCGDFNMQPDDPMKHAIEATFASSAPAFVDGWTHLNGSTPHPMSACVQQPSYASPHCCDYVFVTEDILPRLAMVSYDAETRASDHQPVLARFA
ncbi:MAG: endonuclease/exonuclease/phosphatase family protein [Methylobacterium sp.]|nr:endonuclease/exonuclease/phosphatase family protein [Methylobacterium sp.]